MYGWNETPKKIKSPKRSETQYLPSQTTEIRDIPFFVPACILKGWVILTVIPHIVKPARIMEQHDAFACFRAVCFAAVFLHLFGGTHESSKIKNKWRSVPFPFPCQETQSRHQFNSISKLVISLTWQLLYLSRSLTLSASVIIIYGSIHSFGAWQTAQQRVVVPALFFADDSSSSLLSLTSWQISSEINVGEDSAMNPGTTGSVDTCTYKK